MSKIDEYDLNDCKKLLHYLDMTITDKFDHDEIDYEYYLLKKCYKIINRLVLESEGDIDEDTN